jgi:hypothetical protein
MIYLKAYLLYLLGPEITKDCKSATDPLGLTITSDLILQLLPDSIPT